VGFLRLSVVAHVNPQSILWWFHRAMLQEHPPEVDSNESLTIWLCERHNQANRRLGKPVFECTTEMLEKRWGGCGCEEKNGNPDVAALAAAAAAVTE
jgi:Erv1 / Alr family